MKIDWKYEIIETWQGYEIRKQNGNFYLYLKSIYNEKYVWCSDYLYAKHFTKATAEKHMKILTTKN